MILKLLIIEGPGKIKKIQSILGTEYKILATGGHIEKLKDNEYDHTGISKEIVFNFEIIDDKKNIINEINYWGEKVKEIYIATDPDREGEGIAWHIFNKLTKSNQMKAQRITFNEISIKAINNALMNPQAIDNNYVNAYLTRICLDKKIGYGLSKYLKQQNKLPSAGRVQSVVLRLIKEREDEIKNFVPNTTYYLEPKINNIKLKHVRSKNEPSIFSAGNFSFNTLEEINGYKDLFLKNNKFKLIEISNKKSRKVYPPKPYKTSTIEVDLIQILKINSKAAEKILQILYQKGLITYPRTDSTRINHLFCETAYNYVNTNFEKLANNEFRYNKSKSSGSQDAHEAIRVLDLNLKFPNLEDDLLKAYKIIYENTIIQFLKPCIIENQNFVFKNNLDEFETKSEIILEQGFYEYLNKNKDNKIIDFELNKFYECENFDKLIYSKTTIPPEPFTQSTLIKELEKLGIGRPSTYASAVEINNTRKYTNINKKDILSTTEDGKLANNVLLENWNELINYTFTSSMEEDLDKIASGFLNYKDYLKAFLHKFEDKLNLLTKNYKIMGKCPKCKNDLIEKITKNNLKIVECIDRRYDSKTKQNFGCKFYKFIN